MRKTLRDVRNIPERGVFYLVESRNGLGNSQRFKEELAETEGLETDFIGASDQDCRKWALETQLQYKMVEQDIIAIADKRSASDGTLAMHYYTWEAGVDLEKYGLPPRQENQWYIFRVMAKDAGKVWVKLSYTFKGIVRPVYLERKDEFTDERGVWDYAKADKAVCQG